MGIRHIYLVLCVLGVVLPYWPLADLLAHNDFDLLAYPRGLFGTPVATALTLDLTVTMLAFWCFVLTDGHRQGMRRLWIYLVASVLVNVAVALPMYLYRREVLAGRPPTGS